MVTHVTHLPVQCDKQEGILLCPRRKLDVVDPLSGVLLDAKVQIGRIFEKPNND